MISDHSITSILDEIHRDELTDLAAELVRINSVWDPAAGTGEREVAETVAGWADRQGFQVQQDDIAPNRRNVVIHWTPAPGIRSLLFEGHTDVVTPGDVSAWNRDPFGAEIIENRMYGRGSCDTKGNLAAMLIAMAALKRSGIELNGTIVGGVLCDEEDQMLGVQDFIKRGYADTLTGAVICEPENGLICTSQKGAVRARYRVTGRMTHGAMPLSGLNTAPAVSLIIDNLHRLEKEAVETHGKDELLGWPSFTPTVIQAPPSGTPQLNVLPAEAEILADIRTLPDQSHVQIINELTDVASAAEKKARRHYQAYDRLLSITRKPELQVEIKVLTDRPCTRTDRKDPVVQSAHWATRQVTAKEPEYAGVPGSTDGTYLWALKNIPIVTMGAGERHVPHQVDEWVDLDHLLATAKIYALTALHYLYSTNTG